MTETPTSPHRARRSIAARILPDLFGALDPTADDMSKFAGFCDRMTVQLLQLLALSVLVLTLATWPTDYVFYLDSPSSLRVLTTFRISAVAGAVLLFAALRWSAWLRSRPVQISAILISATVAVDAWALAAWSAPASPFFYGSYMVPFMALVVVRPLAQRVIWSSLLTGSFVVSFSASTGPQWAAVDLWPRYVVIASLLAVGILIGHLFYIIARDNFVRRLQLQQRTYALEGVDRMKDAYVDEVADELKRTEEQLDQARRLESIGQLAGGLAHDFNNLLQIITAHAHFMRDDDMSAKERHECLDGVFEASGEAAQLVQNLLAFGRRQRLQVEVVDLNEVIADSAGLIARLLHPDTAFDLHLSEVPVTTEADGSQLQRILINLALNAADAMADSGCLQIRTERVGGVVRMVVSDDGCGMDEATRQRVFEPFFTTKPASESGGLGMASVYGIVMQTGGEIAVQSAVGEGTTFTLSFPRVRRRSAGVTSQKRAPVKRQSSPLTVLLVEDDPSIRRLVGRLLRREGHRVIEADNGEAAMAAIESGDTIDLLVTDVVMPRLNGIELARRVRESHPRMPLVFMSGYARPDGDAQAILPEGSTFVQKPFEPEDLLAQIYTLVAERAADPAA